MSLNPEIAQIIGKTITAVVTSENPVTPRQQVFLIFSDGTYYELYSRGGDLHSSGSVDEGDADRAADYASRFEGAVTRYE